MTEPTSTIDADEAAFLDLHGQREELERQLALVQLKRQFGPGQASIDQATADEQSLLVSLDRVMTLIRAAEYKRLPNARRW